MEKVRTFLAVDFGMFYQKELARLVGALRWKVQGVRWGDPSKVHLTLHFFGEVSPEELASAEEGIRRALFGICPMEIFLRGVDVFPSMRAPRVFWVGLGGDIEGLDKLKQSLDRELSAKGFLIEPRPFKPHLTIGRAKGRSGGEIPETLRAFEVSRIFRACELILYRSDLSRGGAVHTPIRVFPVGGG
ncbi:MAG TPA: RNA 2',3'-cyclic phosphodiesterase [Candidatus Omnitrophota bacterium]|nr:RNA 2',3'-cyclic phosphodiesterase [Candidatus Omnitrophota bacterium]